MIWIFRSPLKAPRGVRAAGTPHGGVARSDVLNGVLAFLLLLGWVSAQDAAALERFVENHCAACHGGTRQEGGLDLRELDPDAQDVDGLWLLLQVRDRLTAGDMPPAGRPRPAPAELDSAVGLLSQWLSERVPQLAASPGRVTVRRLSRAEYDQTVQDLLGVAPGWGAAFPADDLSYGFDNVGDALVYSALHFEHQLEAAESLAREVFPDEDPSNPKVVHISADGMNSTLKDSLNGDVHGLNSHGTVDATVRVPRRGRYEVRVQAYGRQAGDEPVRLSLSVGSRPLGVVDVTAVSDAPMIYSVDAELEAGVHVVGATFINDYYKPEHPDPAQRDRNAYVMALELRGPLDTLPRLTGRDWITSADPGRGNAGRRLEAMVRPMLLRIWRRPPTTDEVRSLLKYARTGVPDGDLEGALRRALVAALVSPHFAFRVEPVTGKGRAGESQAVPPYALATRLSYFLWGTTPDPELLAAAEKGVLSQPDGLRQEAVRLLAHPKAESLATRFAGQWLEISNLEDVSKDPEAFSMFDDGLRQGFRRETELLVATILFENRPLRDLLRADFTFVNQRLADHYGYEMPEGSGERFERVPVPETRRGILGHGSFHAVTSTPSRTSPVKRGKWILDNLLGTPPPPPPPGVDSLKDDDEATGTSLRERLEHHRRDSACASCHVRMDAFGFALENFDPVGRWRDSDAAGPVDARSELPDGRALDGVVGLRDALSGDPAFLRCCMRKLFVYAVGRNPTPADRLALEGLSRALPKDPTFSDVILGLIELPAFRQREIVR